MHSELDERDEYIVECLREGRKQFRDLEEELVSGELEDKPGKMSKTTLSTHLKNLEEEGVVRRVPGRSSDGRSIVYYELSDLGLEAKITGAIETLRMKFLRDPTIEEISISVGEVPEMVSRVVYGLAQELKWMPPTEEIISLKRRELAYLLEYIAMKKLKSDVEPRTLRRDSGMSKGIIDRAKDYSKRFPGMIPKVVAKPNDEYFIEWGDEAMKILHLPTKETEYPFVYFLEMQED